MSKIIDMQPNDTSAHLRVNWSLIQWNPDIATEELLNIGVALKINNEYYFKMLDYFERVNCLFNQDTIIHLQDVIELSLGAMEQGCFSFSEQIKLVEKGIAKGTSCEAILERLYKRTVSLGRPCIRESNIKRNDFKIVKNEYFVKNISKTMRNKFENNPILKDLFPTQTYIDCEDNRLFVPMQAQRDFGSVVSVVSNKIETIKNNYYATATDLLTAAKVKNKKPTLFILSPSDAELNKLDEGKANQIDLEIDKLNFKFRKHGFEIENEDNKEILIDRIDHWAKKVAAA